MCSRSCFVVPVSVLALPFGFLAVANIPAEGAHRPSTAASPATHADHHSRGAMDNTETAYPRLTPTGGSRSTVPSTPAREHMSPLSALASTGAPARAGTLAYEALPPSYGPARTPERASTPNAEQTKAFGKNVTGAHRRGAKVTGNAKSGSAKRHESATLYPAKTSKSKAAPGNNVSKRSAISSKKSVAKKSHKRSDKSIARGNKTAHTGVRHGKTGSESRSTARPTSASTVHKR